MSTKTRIEEKAHKSIQDTLMDTNPINLQIKEYPNIGDQKTTQQVTLRLINTSKVIVESNMKMSDKAQVEVVEQQSGSVQVESKELEIQNAQVEKYTICSEMPIILRPLNKGEKETGKPSSTGELLMTKE